MGGQRGGGRLHQLAGHLLGLAGPDAPRAEIHQLTALPLGVARQLAAFRSSISRSCSSPRAFIHVHSPEAIDTAPETSAANPARRIMLAEVPSAGQPQDQGHVGHQPIADPNTAARALSALQVAVVLVGVGGNVAGTPPVSGGPRG